MAALQLVHVFETDLGWMALKWAENSLKRLTFGHADPQQALERLRVGNAPARRLTGFPGELRDRLVAYASGVPQVFLDVPLELGDRTPFQVGVLSVCREIPWGDTRCYGELAESVGSPRAARAVGTVMRNNPVPIIIPCHRVVAAGHRWGGFTAPGGVTMKRRMLVMECADLEFSGKS